MGMIKGLAIRMGGKYEEVELRVLADYQDVVEGDIERVDLNLLDNDGTKHRVVMFVNDSFLLGQFDIERDFNELATGLAYVGERQDLRLLGNVVIVGPDHKEESTSFPAEIVYLWVGRINRLQQQMHRSES